MTTEPSPRRVIVAGDAKGAFDALVARVETVHGSSRLDRSTPCSSREGFTTATMRRCEGTVRRGDEERAVPVYFIDADGEKGARPWPEVVMEAGRQTRSSSARGVLEIAPNVYFLSESRVYDLCGGLKVASLPGRYDVLSCPCRPSLGQVVDLEKRRDDGGRRDVDEGEFRRYAEKGCRRCSSHERLAGGDAGHTWTWGP